ncbi:hypothetical protein Bca52824_037169, partial [Brassica carinata]
MRFRSLPSKSLLFRLSLLPPRRFFTNSFSTTASSPSGSTLSSSSRRHHHDEDSRSVRVAVWWDFNKCNLPATANAFKLAQSITSAIRSSGIKGPVTITAFGDVLNLPRSNQEALSSTGITLAHVPQGGKNSADRALITDLISVKARVVPKEVVDKIRVVLSLFPKGLSVSELRSELIKSNVAIDKDYYGHKSFARFLQSMPDVFQVNRASDGLFVVRAVAEKAIPKRLDSNPGLSSSAVDEKINEKVSANASTPKLMTDVELGGDRKGRDISFEKKHEIDKDVKEKAPESSQESILVNQKDVKADDKAVETNQVSYSGSEDSMEDGFFQKLKRMWSGSPEMESEHPPENKNASGSGDKEEGVVNDGKAEDKDLKSSSQGTDSLSQISPSFAGESSEDVKTGTGEAGNSDKNASPGVFSQLLKSFKFWERNKGLSDDSSGNQKLVQVDDIFANESSWSD